MKNWKTTVVGLAGALYLTLQPLLSTGQVDTKLLTLAVIVGILGFVSKDHDVTGGTVTQ